MTIAREAPVGEQRIGLVEDEEGAAVARLRERGGDQLLGPPDPLRHQIGGPLLYDLQAEALGKVAHERALSRARRPLQAEGEAPLAAAPETVREPHRIGVGPDECGVVPGRRLLRRLLAREDPGQAAHAAAHRGEVAAAEPRGGGGPGRHPGGRLELPGQRERIVRPRLDTVARKLPRPDPRPHPGRRQAQLQGEHHPAQDGGIDRPGIVDGPQGRRRRPLQQPVHEHLRLAAGPESTRSGREQPPEEPQTRVGVRKQILHFIEEEERAAAPGDQALGEPELLQPLVAGGLGAVFVRLPDAVDVHPEPSGQHLAELGLAGPRGTVQEDVHARRAGLEGASEQPLDVVAVVPEVVEVRPFELARGRLSQQQAVHVELGSAGNGSQAVQPVDEREVAVVAVDAHEPRPNERRIGPEAVEDRIGRYAEEGGQRGSSEIERIALENVVDHRLDDGLRLVAQHELQDGDVGSGKARRPSKTPEPPRRPIASHGLRGGPLAPQGLFEAAPLLPGHPVRAVFKIPEVLGGKEIIEVQTLAAEGRRERARPPPFPAERPRRLLTAPEHPAATIGGDPLDQLLRFLVTVGRARGKVREIADDQAVLTGGQHGSLRGRGVWVLERGYRAFTSDPGVSAVQPSKSRHPARPARDDGFTWGAREQGAREAETLTVPTVRMASRSRLPARPEGPRPHAVLRGQRAAREPPSTCRARHRHDVEAPARGAVDAMLTLAVGAGRWTGRIILATPGIAPLQ